MAHVRTSVSGELRQAQRLGPRIAGRSAENFEASEIHIADGSYNSVRSRSGGPDWWWSLRYMLLGCRNSAETLYELEAKQQPTISSPFSLY